MGLFTISGNLVTTGLDEGSIPTGPFTGSFVTNGAGPVFTVLGGGITSFLVVVPVAAVVTNPSPNVIFDAIATFTNVSYDSSTQTLTVPTLTATILAGTVPDVGYPFTILMDMTATVIEVPAAASVRPVEGTFATGTYTFDTTTPGGPTPFVQGGGMGCLPHCIKDPCVPLSVEALDAFARVLARGALILSGGRHRG